MHLIDTHTHLYLESFDEDRNQVIERALSEGVNHFFMPSINSKYFNRMFQLKKQYLKNSFDDRITSCYVRRFNEELVKY